MDQPGLQNLKHELAIKAKGGVDFIVAAAIVWLLITYIWTLDTSTYNKSILTFIVGAIHLPLAFVFSKIFKTTWKIKENPLQPLGLLLNFAQLFYFPFLILILIKSPDYFVITYAIITGAHFFPYAWYYDLKPYAIMAGVISGGALILGLKVEILHMYYVPFAMSLALLLLALLINISLRKIVSNYS